MSQDSITISAQTPEVESNNFELLREQGLAYLQEIAGKIWTDYNVHDPGVTTLEQLCYAITDLGYRANFDIQDLLALDENELSTIDLKNFFTAREILTCNPVTVNDFRKILIDLDGIKNAWLEKANHSEVDFYADPPNETLTYDQGLEEDKIVLNGLYEVLLEFDESEEFGDLNDNTIYTDVVVPDGVLEGLTIRVEVQFPYWDHEWSTGALGWESLEEIKSNIQCITLSIREDIDGYSTTLTVDSTNTISVVVKKTSGATQVNKPGLATYLKGLIDALFDEISNDGSTLLEIQQAKIGAIKEVLINAKTALHAHRNLCEDFVKFSSLKIEEIAICADIDITTDVDVEEVLAQIYFLIGQFLAPRIQFYSIPELLKKGKTIEEIFEGPRLCHGFIDDDELNDSERMKTVHVSDLINIIMDIPGVIAIKDIQIANIPLGDSTILSKSVFWCLELAWEKNFVPRLSYDRSKILFFKKKIPYSANKEETEELVEVLLSELKQKEEQIPALDLPVPKGKYFDLEGYTSIQEQYPVTYGIGEVGLPPSATAERKAQAKQLKGFLLFFDQILANYCSQLSHVKHLFSMNSSISRTYFTQVLTDIPNVPTILKDFNEYANLSKNPSEDDEKEVKAKWETFSADATNAHLKKLNEIAEDKELFYERRNEFLDHLMARFSEQFVDYALLMYRIDSKKAPEELIEDKLQFLQEYPTISYERGKAFYYFNNEEEHEEECNNLLYEKSLWDTTNVTGLEKRLSKLVGIADYKRKSLACPELETQIERLALDGKFFFKFKDAWNKVLFTSKAFNLETQRETAITQFIEKAVDIRSFELIESEDGTFGFKLFQTPTKLIGTGNVFDTEIQRNEQLQLLISYIVGNCNHEGMHLLEHILLRPRTEDDRFIKTEITEECGCGLPDLYSFRASLILPYWPDRFRNMAFRNFLEETARLEAPAHVHLKICWINEEQMDLFEAAYQSWLIALRDNSNELSDRQNELLDVLDQLRNVYPEATLHDCESGGEGSSPVMLGQTILGTLKSTENE